MPVKFVDKFTIGWLAVVEADEGCLLGGSPANGAIFDSFFAAVHYMAVVIDNNVKANRSVRLGKVMEFKGMARVPTVA